MTVQHIKNEFTVEVYEENMLFCLDAVDYVNFEKCGKVLLPFYTQGLKGRANVPIFLVLVVSDQESN